jgi:hypothetical protein
VTTCLNIVTQALRLGKVVASGDSPSADEAADGLACLQSLYDAWIAAGMFGQLKDLYKAEAYSALEGERITAPSGVVVTFPTALPDLTNGGNRAPRDLSCIETIIDGVRVVKIWDRTAWVALRGLALSDAAPLAERGAVGLSAALACSGAFLAEFGDEGVSPRVERLARQFNGTLSYKAGTTQDISQAEYF